jgi:hypothetical protein
MPSANTIGLSPPSEAPSAWSPAVRLMLRPTVEYRAQRALGLGGSWIDALATPVLMALLLGVVTVVSSTGRVSASFVLSGAICWSFVPILQLAMAAAFIPSPRTTSISRARAIELWFLAHGPWSIWILVVGCLMALVPVSLDLIVVSGLVPAFWTASILGAFFREVGGLSRRAAGRRTLVHQAVTWILILGYIELATATSTRIIGALQP